MLDILLNLLIVLGILVTAGLIILAIAAITAAIVGTIGYIRKDDQDNEKRT